MWQVQRGSICTDGFYLNNSLFFCVFSNGFPHACPAHHLRCPCKYTSEPCRLTVKGVAFLRLWLAVFNASGFPSTIRSAAAAAAGRFNDVLCIRTRPWWSLFFIANSKLAARLV